jgi:hypothetical protein
MITRCARVKNVRVSSQLDCPYAPAVCNHARLNIGNVVSEEFLHWQRPQVAAVLDAVHIVVEAILLLQNRSIDCRTTVCKDFFDMANGSAIMDAIIEQAFHSEKQALTRIVSYTK